MKLIDISLLISPSTITYPGNPKVSIISKKTNTSVISTLVIGTHTGTHIDSPRHAFKNGKGIDSLSLDSFVGDVRVLNLASVKKTIEVMDLKKHRIKKGERILVKTSNSKRGYKKFYSDYVHLSPEAAQFLGDTKISLFGIDYLSVKQRGNPDNRPHTELLKRNIAILEGIDLSKVSAGSYLLIALPLKIKGGDGSPTRAVLARL